MSGTYNVTVGRLDLELPIVPVSETTSIAFIQLLGENELIRTVCAEFAERISRDAEVIPGPETVGIVIAHQLSEMTGLPMS
jgi:adenine phosphoribosyltransferase